MPEAAISLGIATNMLYKWKEKIEAELEEKALFEDERAELMHLRKENKELRTQQQIG